MLKLKSSINKACIIIFGVFRLMTTATLLVFVYSKFIEHLSTHDPSLYETPIFKVTSIGMVVVIIFYIFKLTALTAREVKEGKIL